MSRIFYDEDLSLNEIANTINDQCLVDLYSLKKKLRKLSLDRYKEMQKLNSKMKDVFNSTRKVKGSAVDSHKALMEFAKNNPNVFKTKFEALNSGEEAFGRFNQENLKNFKFIDMPKSLIGSGFELTRRNSDKNFGSLIHKVLNDTSSRNNTDINRNNSIFEMQ